MSARDLELADRRDIVAPALRFGDLAADHIALEDLTGVDVEGVVMRRLRATDEVVCIVGRSGEGKSSVIAAVCQELVTDPAVDGPQAPGDRHFVTLRVPVAPSAEDAAKPDVFGRLAIEQLARHARDIASGRQRKRIDEALADQVARRSSGAKVGVHLDLHPIPGLGGGVAAEFAAAATALTSKVAPHAVLGGLDALVSMLRERGREPVLVIEDTDQWARLGNGNDIADAFFGRIVHTLARELDVSCAVAVQDRYAGRGSFGGIRDLVRVVTLPSPTDPARALGQLIGGRIARYLEGPADHRRLLDDAALGELGARWAADGNLRRVLRQLGGAIESLGPDYPEQISLELLLAASPDE